ncbi:MAG: hypothetical protein ABUT20_60410, partial [Bacteroidota bacterium]
MTKKTAIIFLLFLPVIAAAQQTVVFTRQIQAVFPIVSASQATSICIDKNDNWLTKKTASLFSSDIEMVSGKKPQVVSSLPPVQKNIIIIGTIGESSFLKKLSEEKKIDVRSIQNKWDAFLIQIVQQPF